MLHTRIAPAGAALPGLTGGVIVDATNPPGRLSQFMRLAHELDREEVGIAVDHLIELLDAADGDIDAEFNGDEADVSCLDFQPRDPLYRRAEYRDAAIALATEDDESDGDDQDENRTEDGFVTHDADGPGCPIADTPTDTAWAEWTSRGRHKLEREAEPLARGAYQQALQEDDEDDDPAEQDDEPEENGDQEGIDEREGGSVAEWMGSAAADPHAYPDDDQEDEGLIVRRPYIAAARRRAGPRDQYGRLLVQLPTGRAVELRSL